MPNQTVTQGSAFKREARGNWEDTFRSWAKGPGSTEGNRCENAVKAVRDAIASSQKLQARNIEVFLQGSYRNRVNVRQDSDVDIGIVCRDTFFYQLPEGHDKEDYGIYPSTYNYSQFKNEIEEALVQKFGRTTVKRGNKAFDIKANSYRVEADVAPLFEHRRYSSSSSYASGVELIPDNGGIVINWPEQHYSNGVRKNSQCNRRYKRLVRIIKKLCNEMADDGSQKTDTIPGFLCECLTWNVRNDCFGYLTYSEDLRNALIYLYERLGTTESDEWGEVSELKYLFRGHQKWTKDQARAFVVAVWNYVGFK